MEKTLRDEIAIHAPFTLENAEQAIPDSKERTYEQAIKTLCVMRYVYADEMLKAREIKDNG